MRGSRVAFQMRRLMSSGNRGKRGKDDIVVVGQGAGTRMDYSLILKRLGGSFLVKNTRHVDKWRPVSCT
jgi:hypothetical protein